MSDEALFGMSCEEHQDELSEWSQCIIPHGDLADAITRFLRSVKNFGCKVSDLEILISSESSSDSNDGLDMIKQKPSIIRYQLLNRFLLFY